MCWLVQWVGVWQVHAFVHNVYYCMCATVFVSVLEHIICLKASWATRTPKLLEDADLEELAGARSCTLLLPEQVRGPWVKGLLWMSIQVSEMSKKAIKVSRAQRAPVARAVLSHPCRNIKGISRTSVKTWSAMPLRAECK